MPTVANATSYSWTLPSGWSITSGAGTNTITVSIDNTATTGTKNITVVASNACGASAASPSLSVTIGTFASAVAGANQVLCSTATQVIYNATAGGL